MFVKKKLKNKNYAKAVINKLNLPGLMIRLNTLVSHIVFQGLIMCTSLTACCAENKPKDGTVHIYMDNADLVYNDPYHRYINEGNEGELIFVKDLVSDTSGNHLKFMISPQLSSSAVGTVNNVAELPNSELTW